jgi:hypothetical protein
MKFGTDVMDAIQGDLDAVIFNPIASTILQWLYIKLNKKNEWKLH